jgi:hypothetical protein
MLVLKHGNLEIRILVSGKNCRGTEDEEHEGDE